MPVVGIFSQKGGEGKSTIIDFLATSIQVLHNKENNKSKVLVIDADFPQLSVYKLRKLEHKFLQENNEDNKYFFDQYTHYK